MTKHTKITIGLNAIIFFINCPLLYTETQPRQTECTLEVLTTEIKIETKHWNFSYILNIITKYHENRTRKL